MSFNTDQISNPTAAPSGSTVYCRFIRQSDGKFANTDTETLDTYDAADIADYGVIAPEIGTSGVYLITIPTWLPAANYVGYYYVQAGAGQAVDDVQFGQFLPFYWTGTTAVDLGTIYAKFATSVIIVASPVDVNGNLRLVQGDDYSTETGRPLTWTVATSSLPSMVGASVSLGLVTNANYNATSFSNPSLTQAGTITEVDANTVFSVALTDEQTAALMTRPTANCAEYTFQLRVKLASGEFFSIQIGTATITKRVLAQA
jgi:hypothetical protein